MLHTQHTLRGTPTRVLVAACTVALTLSGCSAIKMLHNGAPTSSPAAAQGICHDVQAQRWVTVSSDVSAGKATVRLPQPANWDSAPELAKAPIALVLQDSALATPEGMVPALLVAITDVTDKTKPPISSS